jgi:hypothetical protein
MKKIVGILILVTVSASLVQAQGDLGQLIKGSVSDANYLANGYITPLLKTTSASVNQGWYNTAKPHQFPGFDLTFSVSYYRLPSSELQYEVDNTKLTNLQLTQTASGQAVTSTGKANVPTVFGPDGKPKYVNKATGFGIDGPPGLDLKGKIGISTIPIPLANIGIGLPKNTELKIRYFPKTNFIGVGEFSLIGFGLVHDVKQYIPGIKNLPFDLSGFVGYTKVTLNTNLDYPDQKAEFDVTGITVQGLISKKISVVTLYGALGYNSGKSTLGLKGMYDLDGNTSNGRETSNPIKLEQAASGVRATAGIRLKLAVFTLHADYSLQKFSTITAGLGISVR